METPLVVYVDVDDTLVRSVGVKRVPMPAVVRHVEKLFQAGTELYCWSTGGGAYAEETARELGIHHCFRGFLPKPHVVLDDQSFAEWRMLVHEHPLNCHDRSADDYRRMLGTPGYSPPRPWLDPHPLRRE